MSTDRATAVISAAIAGVSHPFATARARARQQDCPPPPQGSDSCYGVRSLEGSVSWSYPDLASPSSSTDPRDQPQQESGNAQDKDSFSLVHTESAETVPPSGQSETQQNDEVEDRQHDSFIQDEERPDLGRKDSIGSDTSTIGGQHVEANEPTSDGSTTSTLSPSRVSPSNASTSTVHPQIPIEHTTTQPRESRAQEQDDPVAVGYRHALFDMLADVSSEPSSPTSLASMPSYPASFSSLSRVSSSTDWEGRHPLATHVTASDMEDAALRYHRASQPGLSGSLAGLGLGSEDLVLPTLSLPSTSLQLGLDKWAGPGAGTRIALVASPERSRNVLRCLSERRRCVQVRRGEVGIVRHSEPGASPSCEELEATVLTGLTPEELKARALSSYLSLHALLNPTPPGASHRADLEAMAGSYAANAEWVHLVIMLEDTGSGEAIEIIPVTTLEFDDTKLDSSKLASSPSPLESGAHTPSAQGSHSSTSISDPEQGRGPSDLEESHNDGTPRWESYQPLTALPEGPSLQHAQDQHSRQAESHVRADITAQLLEASTNSPVFNEWIEGPGVDPAVQLLEGILDDPHPVRAASTAAFLAWRPSAPMTPPPVYTSLPSLRHGSSRVATTAGSRTGETTSPASSIYDVSPGTGLMPTVARAQGGGEWEATLSRRLAHRREHEAAQTSRGGIRGSGVRGSNNRGRTRPSRRRSPPTSSVGRPSKDSCGPPLFPKRDPVASSVGLVDLIGSVFSDITSTLAQTPWKKVVVACAVALAVGWAGWWVGVKA